MRYWLMKSEPETFSITDLEREGETLWDGVRNYQARNFMQNEMHVGDQILFYRSNAKPPGVVGLASVAGPAVADPSQFRAASDGFEPKASRSKPIWFCVPVRHLETFARMVSLAELQNVSALENMLLLRKGQRLSVQPVTRAEFEAICALARA